jgi:hypothetical protein
MGLFGLQPISRFFGEADTKSVRKWSVTAAKNTHDTCYERKMMEEKKKYVPQELRGRITRNRKMDKQTSPQWLGEIMVKGQIIRFSVWENDGEYGPYFSIKVSDPDWKPQQQQQYPRDVTPGVRRPPRYDGDIPF